MAKVGIVMGSDSDMPIMSKAADILEKLGIDYEMKIISAHREPDVFFEYAKTAEEKGFKVIIAGAGMAAHLPGMCAAIFPMPVIGIPMHTTSLGGRDSLYSIVQMPSGIPVATVAINGGADPSVKDTCEVTVTTQNIPVTGVTLTPAALDMKVGGTATLTANVQPANATNQSVSWSSSNESVATVRNGVATGRK